MPRESPDPAGPPKPSDDRMLTELQEGTREKVTAPFKDTPETAPQVTLSKHALGVMCKDLGSRTAFQKHTLALLRQSCRAELGQTYKHAQDDFIQRELALDAALPDLMTRERFMQFLDELEAEYKRIVEPHIDNLGEQVASLVRERDRAIFKGEREGAERMFAEAEKGAEAEIRIPFDEFGMLVDDAVAHFPDIERIELEVSRDLVSIANRDWRERGQALLTELQNIRNTVCDRGPLSEEECMEFLGRMRKAKAVYNEHLGKCIKRSLIDERRRLVGTEMDALEESCLLWYGRKRREAALKGSEVETVIPEGGVTISKQEFGNLYEEARLKTPRRKQLSERFDGLLVNLPIDDPRRSEVCRMHSAENLACMTTTFGDLQQIHQFVEQAALVVIDIDEAHDEQRLTVFGKLLATSEVTQWRSAIQQCNDTRRKAIREWFAKKRAEQKNVACEEEARMTEQEFDQIGHIVQQRFPTIDEIHDDIQNAVMSLPADDPWKARLAAHNEQARAQNEQVWDAGPITETVFRSYHQAAIAFSNRYTALIREKFPKLATRYEKVIKLFYAAVEAEILALFAKKRAEQKGQEAPPPISVSKSQFMAALQRSGERIRAVPKFQGMDAELAKAGFGNAYRPYVERDSALQQELPDTINAARAQKYLQDLHEAEEPLRKFTNKLRGTLQTLHIERLRIGYATLKEEVEKLFAVPETKTSTPTAAETPRSERTVKSDTFVTAVTQQIAQKFRSWAANAQTRQLLDAEPATSLQRYSAAITRVTAELSKLPEGLGSDPTYGRCQRYLADLEGALYPVKAAAEGFSGELRKREQEFLLQLYGTAAEAVERLFAQSDGNESVQQRELKAELQTSPAATTGVYVFKSRFFEVIDSVVDLYPLSHEEQRLFASVGNSTVGKAYTDVFDDFQRDHVIRSRALPSTVSHKIAKQFEHESRVKFQPVKEAALRLPEPLRSILLQRLENVDRARQEAVEKLFAESHTFIAAPKSPSSPSPF